MRKKLILAAVLVLPVIAVSTANLSSGGSSNLEKITFKKGGLCIGLDISGPEYLRTLTARRMAYKAQSFYFELPVDTQKYEFSLSFSSAEIPTGKFKPTYYSQCNFIEDIGGFQEQIEGKGCLVQPQFKKVYHSEPGSKSNVRVDCSVHKTENCSLRLTEEVGPVNVRIFATMHGVDRDLWMAFSDSVRSLIKKRVSHLSNC